MTADECGILPRTQREASTPNAILKEPIRYSEETPELVRLVFMVATGTNEREYLNVLRLIATNISHASVHERLLSAHDVHEVHHLLSELKTTQPLSTQSE